MWYRNQGTATVATGSNTVILNDVDTTRPEFQVGFGFAPIIDGLPLYEITGFNFAGGEMQMIIEPAWQGDAQTIAFAIAPMMGQLRKIRQLLEGIEEFQQALTSGTAINTLVIGDGADGVLFSVGDNTITLNAPVSGSVFIDDEEERTPGMLLRTGDYGGHGLPVPINSQFDFDDLIGHGTYSFSGADAPANSPVDLVSGAGIWNAEVERRTTSLVRQKAYRFSTNAAFNRELYRTRALSGPSEWVEYITSGRVAGSMTEDIIAQALSTGLWSRIIEAQTTTHGGYMRLAGGIQVCWGRTGSPSDAIVSSGSVYRGTRQWTFPAPFSTTDGLQVFCSAQEQNMWGGRAGAYETTHAILTHYSGSPISSEHHMIGFAIGRYA